MMRGAVLVAVAATVGNLLQGWDNSTIAGAILYIKKELNLEKNPTVEGLIVSMSLIGAITVTTFSGPVSDKLGRRPMLIISSFLYLVSGLINLWVPNVYILLLARLIDGFAVGLAVTLTPLYISETAPSEIRGLLNTIPQFAGAGGLFLAYCLVFFMSLGESPSWRSMLGVICLPSLGYLLLAVFFLPESPRWLVSKGRMLEAKKVLQRLRGRDDVSGELALLVEGLSVQPEASVEEYVVFPVDPDKDKSIMPKDSSHSLMMAKPLQGQSALNIANSGPSRGGEGVAGSLSGSFLTKDPLVSMFDSVHEPGPTSQTWNSLDSAMMNASLKNSNLDLEGQNKADGAEFDATADDDDNSNSGLYDDMDDLRTPLLSREATEFDKDNNNGSGLSKSNLSMRIQSRLILDEGGEQVSCTDIGSGWQMAWKLTDEQVTRIYLHPNQVVRSGSMFSVHDGQDDEPLVARHASALVNRSIISPKELRGSRFVEPALFHSPGAVQKGPGWRDLCEPGIKRALLVGVGLQILQQAGGINGVLYYAPQILEQAGVAVLLSGFGIRTDSASFLIGCLITFAMLPCIALSMRLMDVSGRRSILLWTIPILIASLLLLVLSSILTITPSLYAIISTSSVLVYLSVFQMGFGIVPNILCSEIFPTRVRGLCITICALTYWTGNMAVTYVLPILLSAIGLSSVFGLFVVACIVSWIFVYLKVPETKGMPLEVICEFFSAGARSN